MISIGAPATSIQPFYKKAAVRSEFLIVLYALSIVSDDELTRIYTESYGA